MLIQSRYEEVKAALKICATTFAGPGREREAAAAPHAAQRDSRAIVRHHSDPRAMARRTIVTIGSAQILAAIVHFSSRGERVSLHRTPDFALPLYVLDVLCVDSEPLCRRHYDDARGAITTNTAATTRSQRGA